MAKLFIVVRADLDAGAQAAQACHAYGEFEEQHPAIYRAWKAQHQNLVILSARDEQHLRELLHEADRRRVATAKFYEPDLGRSLTAIALEDAAAKMLSSLPLALRREAVRAERSGVLAQSA